MIIFIDVENILNVSDILSETLTPSVDGFAKELSL